MQVTKKIFVILHSFKIGIFKTHIWWASRTDIQRIPFRKVGSVLCENVICRCCNYLHFSNHVHNAEWVEFRWVPEPVIILWKWEQSHFLSFPINTTIKALITRQVSGLADERLIIIQLSVKSVLYWWVLEMRKLNPGPTRKSKNLWPEEKMQKPQSY